MNKIPHDPNEIIAVVDENDSVIDETTRGQAHKTGILHREVYVYFINSQNQVLLQKRSDNNLWDLSSSGHFQKDLTYEDGARKEVEEELGISLREGELVEIAYEQFNTTKLEKKNYRFAKVYLVRKDISLNDLNLDRGEVTEVKFFDKSELEELLNSEKKIMTGSSKHIIEKYVLKELT
jgi:isopentenyl-diphosphate delta-isomerase